MEIKEISKYAALNKSPEEALSVPEWLLYYRLRDIYTDYKKNNINQALGEKRKNSALSQFEKDKKMYDFAEKILNDNTNMWKRIDNAAIQYCKNPCVETADIFYKTVYNGTERKKKENENN